MKDNKNIIIVVVFVLAIAGVIFLAKSKSNNTAPTEDTGLSNQSEVPATSTAPKSVSVQPKNTTKSATDSKAPVEAQDYNPTIKAGDFISTISNPFFTLLPGTSFTYETTDGSEKDIVIVTNRTKIISGVKTTEVWDRVWKGSELIEETTDWYAQDKEGNVWYFGEDSKEYKNGKVTSTDGSWKSGVSGAKPGIIMKAHPKIGESYRQEYSKGVAEDAALVVSLGEIVQLSSRNYSECLKTKDYSYIEPGVSEYKYYCPEAGNLALETDLDGGQRLELISIEKVSI